MDILEVSIYLAAIVCATEIIVCEIQREIQLAERERGLYWSWGEGGGGVSSGHE